MIANIVKIFLCTFKNSCTINFVPNDTDTYRAKYLNSTGTLFILKNKRQFFRFNPIIDNQLNLNKGLHSSPDDFFISNNEITIKTVNSIYKFGLIKELEPQNLQEFLR